MSDQKIRVAISVGDFNGIGPEIILKSLADPLITDLCTPVIFGSQKIFSFYKKHLSIEDGQMHIIKNADEIHHKKVNLVNISDEEIIVEPGKSTPAAGAWSLKSLEAATDAVLSGKADVLVTAPINKSNIQSDTFNFPGHTEYLAHKSGGVESLMILFNDTLRVALVTGHIPVSQISSKLSTELILQRIQKFSSVLLQDYGIRNPKIAVLGLNPHAGDNGLLGEEEKTIIAPAVQSAREKNILAFGPYPADGFFSGSGYKTFDGILAMYHDQGLIPFKHIAAHDGVNFTAGLPFVRTSPDHGTAYDIAGKNQADHRSFTSALFAAIDIHRTRQIHKEISANPLKGVPLKRERS